MRLDVFCGSNKIAVYMGHEKYIFTGIMNISLRILTSLSYRLEILMIFFGVDGYGCSKLRASITYGSHI